VGIGNRQGEGGGHVMLQYFPFLVDRWKFIFRRYWLIMDGIPIVTKKSSYGGGEVVRVAPLVGEGLCWCLEKCIRRLDSV